jgi:membrane protease subunit (stomatin/prohibitin family)
VFVRRRPLLRAAAVGGAGYMAGKRSAQRAEQEADQNQQIQELQQQQQAQAPPPPAAAPSQSTSDRIAALSQLKELLDQGVLTQAEFEAEKAKLLQGG